MPLPSFLFLAFELDSRFSSNRGNGSSLVSQSTLAFLYSPPFDFLLLARWWIKWSLLQFANEGAEGDARGGDSTVNLGVVFPLGAVDLSPLGEKCHRR